MRKRNSKQRKVGDYAGNTSICEDQAVGFRAPPQKQDPDDENENDLVWETCQ